MKTRARKEKRKPIFIIKASKDEKQWESKINWFSWIAIIAWLIVAIVASVALNYQQQLLAEKTNSAQLDAEMKVWHTEYDKCIYEKEHMPIINGLEVKVIKNCTGEN